jgi:CO/xanthine dehydrogenase Mo-binding subunit
MHTEIAATQAGKILALKVNVIAGHGAFNNTAQPTKFPAGFFHIFTGSYDYPAAHCTVKDVYTNKAPGGVAYACSFRITEAAYAVERIVDCLAFELDMDPAELRMKNLLRPEQFPYRSPTGWEYDSGNYPLCLQKAMEIAGYDELRREQAEKRERGELMGIGVSFFTEGVGAGPRKHMDILGLGMADGAELRGAPDGQGSGTDIGSVAGSGARDDVRPDRLGDHRDPFRRHRCGPWGYRQHPVRVGHLRQSFDAGLRCCGRRSGEACRGQSKDHRRDDDGGLAA